MRYLILVMVLGTISFNQVFIIFMDYRDILGVWIYVFTFIYMLTYVGVICLNLFWLFPKYLLKRHYMTYLSVLSVAMVIALLIQMVIEYLAYSHWPQLHARGSYFGSHADGLHFFFYAVNALHDRRNDDFASERMDD